MKKLITAMLLLCLTMALIVPAGALEYTINAPGDPDYGKATSIEPVITADGGAMKNEDVSKNAALVPPAFGSPSADTLGTGSYLTPNLAPATMTSVGEIISGSSAVIMPPAADGTGSAYVPGASAVTVTTPGNSSGYTEVTADLYNQDGSLGTLTIRAIGLSVKVYQGTDSATLTKGVGHFEQTSIWGSNVALAGHNRGVNSFFGQIHTLTEGDQITFTTVLGARTYEVTSVYKVSETDNSMLASTTDNCLTLLTCVRNQSAYRWCVRAVEI